MVSIGPYSLVLVPRYAGPLFEAKGQAERLATLLNHAVDLPKSGIAEAIEQGIEGGNDLVSVSPAEDEDEDRKLREAWAAHTGEQLGPGSVARIDMAVAGYDEPLAIPWTTLRAGLAELRARRAAWKPEPGPWLFKRPASAPFITPEDHALVLRLKDEAAAIDALNLEAQVGREPQPLIERRRAFLQECREAGVFAPDHGEVREQWLHLWQADRLLALRRAAAKLRAFGLLGEDEEPPAGAVCLDYARLELWPPGEDGASWARSALKLLRPNESGEQGAILQRVGGSTVRVWWRRDHDRPALLAIARGP